MKLSKEDIEDLKRSEAVLVFRIINSKIEFKNAYFFIRTSLDFDPIPSIKERMKVDPLLEMINEDLSQWHFIIVSGYDTLYYTHSGKFTNKILDTMSKECPLEMKEVIENILLEEALEPNKWS